MQRSQCHFTSFIPSWHNNVLPFLFSSSSSLSTIALFFFLYMSNAYLHSSTLFILFAFLWFLYLKPFFVFYTKPIFICKYIGNIVNKVFSSCSDNIFTFSFHCHSWKKYIYCQKIFLLDIQFPVGQLCSISLLKPSFSFSAFSNCCLEFSSLKIIPLKIIHIYPSAFLDFLPSLFNIFPFFYPFHSYTPLIFLFIFQM